MRRREVIAGPPARRPSGRSMSWRSRSACGELRADGKPREPSGGAGALSRRMPILERCMTGSPWRASETVDQLWFEGTSPMHQRNEGGGGAPSYVKVLCCPEIARRCPSPARVDSLLTGPTSIFAGHRIVTALPLRLAFRMVAGSPVVSLTESCQFERERHLPACNRKRRR